MRRIVVCFLLALLAGQLPVVLAAEGIPNSPEEILRLIEKEGAGAVLLEASDKDLFRLLRSIERGIGRGDGDWAEAARRLRPLPTGDQHIAEEMDFAVSMALPHAPRLVLSLLDDPFPLNNICTIPYDAEHDKAEVLKHLLASEDALMSFSIPPQRIETDALYIADDAPTHEMPSSERKRRACLHKIQMAKCLVVNCEQLGRAPKRK